MLPGNVSLALALIQVPVIDFYTFHPNESMIYYYGKTIFLLIFASFWFKNVGVNVAALSFEPKVVYEMIGF